MHSNAPTPSRSQLLQWFQSFTSSPPTLTSDSLRKVIYLLHTNPDIPQANPSNLAVFLQSLGRKFGEWVKCTAALTDLHDVLVKLLELKPDKACKKLLKREYVDQMEQITHHRLKNEAKRREHERKKQQNSQTFVSHCLERHRQEKKRLAQLAFESQVPTPEPSYADEDEEIRKRVKAAMFESPFQPLDFVDSISLDLPEMQQTCEYKVVAVPEMLPTVAVRLPELLERPAVLSDPRLIRRIKANGLREVLEVEEVRKELPRFSLILDVELTIAEPLDQARIQALSVLIPSHSSVLKGPGEDLFLVPRPGLREFLQRISKFATLTLHTSSLSSYTAGLIKALDPEDRLIQGGISTSPEDCMGPADLDRLLVLSARPSLWDDGHLLQSLPYALSKYGRETEFRVSALSEVLYGQSEPLPWASDRDDSELTDIAEALEAVYTRFLLSGAIHTFAHSMRLYRSELLSDFKVSFSVYERSIGEPDYTPAKLSLYRFAARHLGATEEAGQWEVAEYTNPEKKLLAGVWLISCFFRLKKGQLG